MIGSSGQKQMTWVLRIGYLYQNELKQYFTFSDTSVELRHFRPPSEVSEHCKLFMLMTPPSSLLGWDQPSRCEKHIKKNIRLKAGWGSSIVCFFLHVWSFPHDVYAFQLFISDPKVPTCSNQLVPSIVEYVLNCFSQHVLYYYNIVC